MSTHAHFAGELGKLRLKAELHSKNAAKLTAVAKKLGTPAAHRAAAKAHSRASQSHEHVMDSAIHDDKLSDHHDKRSEQHAEAAARHTAAEGDASRTQPNRVASEAASRAAAKAENYSAAANASGDHDWLRHRAAHSAHVAAAEQYARVGKSDKVAHHEEKADEHAKIVRRRIK